MRVPALLLLFLAGSTRAADDDVFVLSGARVHTVAGAVIEPGAVVVRGERIEAVGPAGEVAIPEGARLIDTTGLVVIPGLVDTHSHVGVHGRPSVAANADVNEATGPVQPLVRAADAINPADPGFRLALAGGVTTANIMPGSANVMGGQTAYVKCRGRTVDEMLIDLRGGPGGMKMANGENPKRTYGGRDQSPATRMKIAALQREIFLKAREYAEKGRKPFDPALEPVLEILERRRTVHFHTHRADDVMSAIRLAEEFGFELVLHHVTEAFLVRDEIAKAGFPVSLIVLDSPGGKPEAHNLRFDNAALCHEAGLLVAIHSDDPITESRFLLRSAALAVRGGLPPDVALRAVTLDAAKMLHLDARIGSIEPGKDADLVVLDGDPFSVYTRVLETYVEGERVFSRETDLRYATGGYGVAERMPQEPLPRTEKPEPVARPEGARGDPASPRVAILAGRVHTAAGPPIANGVVLIEDGKIAAVGSRDEIGVPEGWAVVTAAEVTPGFIDAHSSVGLAGMHNLPADRDQDEAVAPNQAALRVVDGFNPAEELLDHLLRHGVTLIQCMPGPKNPIAGQAGVFRTYGRTVEEMTVRFPSAMLFNLGEEPKQTYGGRRQAPATRMGLAALIRRELLAAARPEEEEPEEGEEGKVDVDLNRAALRRVASGEIPSVFAAHRADDVLTALRLMRELDLSGMVSQATEGYLVADLLAEAGVPVLAAPTMQRAGDLERDNTTLANAALLARAGVDAAITSGFEGYVPKTRVVLFEAAVAAANGLGRDAALRAITIVPARLLGVDDRYGSLEPGKVADVVLFDGDPLEYTTPITALYTAGMYSVPVR